ncbi:MAG: hypothetical protein IPM36_05035 [Lewinellaceae bacterium]|nr:hypothetical protein [Lewinellaceae bacterium]
MKNILLPVLLLFSVALPAQETRNGAPTIFLDCQWWCDQQYLKTEMTYLNFVRDRADADIFIQQTGLRNGGGGEHLTLFFFGQKQFAGQRDTVVFDLPPAVSENESRQALKQNLERGLLPYLLQTPLAGRISFSVEIPEATDMTIAEQKDPWNFWTFSARANMYFGGQEVSKSLEMFGRLEANRVTEQQKTWIAVGGDYGRNTFQFDDTLKEVYVNGGYFLQASQVLSIREHWSYGFFAGGKQAQYNNLKLNAFLDAGLEYNLFAYREVARRQLRFRYRVGPRYNRYFDETIFFKSKETLFAHSLALSYQQVFEWGRFNLGFNQSNYLHDWALNRTNIFGGLELNLFKGFNFYLDGDFSLVHNQIELPNGGASKEEALLRIRQLQSGYNFYMYFGVSYTFGSIYSNVVNPRF